MFATNPAGPDGLLLATRQLVAHRELVLKKQWNQLDPCVRRVIIVGGIGEALLKVAALIDLKRRPSAEVNGPKLGWAAAITFVNSVGAVPALYFRFGRRKARGGH